MFEAGHFTAYDNFNSTNHDDDVAPSYGSGKPGNSMTYEGGAYTINDNASVMLYAAQYEDTWNQYFTNINYAIPFSDDEKLEFDFNLYHTADTGRSYQGDIDNTIFSIKPRYTNGRHTFAMAYQQVNGDTPFDYVGYDSIWVSNSSQYSDFNAPEEKSIGVGYRLDLSGILLDGASIGSKYTKGDEINGTHADPAGGYAGYYGDNGKHWERDVEIKYVVQSGTAKDLSFRLRQATHRANADQGEGDVDEVRFIVEYPHDFL
jgi:imipenem/basic amino acid-specific outer membrane pore